MTPCSSPSSSPRGMSAGFAETRIIEEYRAKTSGVDRASAGQGDGLGRPAQYGQPFVFGSGAEKKKDGRPGTKTQGINHPSPRSELGQAHEWNCCGTVTDLAAKREDPLYYEPAPTSTAGLVRQPTRATWRQRKRRNIRVSDPASCSGIHAARKRAFPSARESCARE